MWKFNDVIFIEGDNFRVEDEIYGLNNIDKFLIKAKKRRKIIIYNESIFNKEITLKNSKGINEKEIDKRIIEEFGLNHNYLFNYNFTGKVLNLYAVKGGILVEALCKNAQYIDVLPVQLILKKIIQKEINKGTWCSILKFKDYFYFISVYKGNLKIALAEKDYQSILNRINGFNEIYIHKDIEFIKSELKNIEVVQYIEGEVNERIIKKQRLYS